MTDSPTNHLIEAIDAIQKAENPNNTLRERHIKLAIGHALIALVQEVGLLRENLEGAGDSGTPLHVEVEGLDKIIKYDSLAVIDGAEYV